MYCFCFVEELGVLAFLRARKYVIPRSKELFERACLFVKQNPEICILDEEKYTKAMNLYDSGAITVMKERDSLGRRIILCTTRKFDTSKYTLDDTMRLFNLILCVLSFEEDTQKNGTIFINDLNGLSLSHLKLFPYKMLANYSSYMNISVVRIKEIYVVGMPSIAVQLFKAIRYVLDDKNRSRLQVMSDLGNLWQFVDQSKMTTDYGGKSFTNTDTLYDFKSLITSNKDRIFELSKKFIINTENKF